MSIKISYNSTQAKCANKSFHVIIKRLLNTCSVANLGNTQICYFHLRKLTIYLDKLSCKSVLLGHLKSTLATTKEVIEASLSGQKTALQPAACGWQRQS